ncbi:PaaI family thioesterase [Nocardia sp. SYP-A9097]|uniref:PaaI family thioesterase n=1 Tax=Nocardia sp. SYP-A9097 TaxID=2663237 RepID=UPI00129A4984|nr:PaaI family thioesterase [Nocardia sp. SYP-A9097]MRH90853.1 PaaI family thioesterase [Nocardia sp. SYP-A9097]
MEHDRETVPLPLGELFAEGPLPAHHHGCFGCGPSNPASPRIVFERRGDTVRGTFTMDERHQGAPGVAHGGIVAAALDEASGSILMPLRQPAVTVKLDVNFRSPARLGRELVVTSQLSARKGRKLFIDSVLTDGETVIATGYAIFVEVPQQHFVDLGATPGELFTIGG